MIRFVFALSLLMACSTEGGPEMRSGASQIKAEDGKKAPVKTPPAPSVPAPMPAPQSAEPQEDVSSPSKITGAHLVAKIIPGEDPGKIRVGIVGMLDDVRLSDEPDVYKNTWALGFTEVVATTVTLDKSTDRDFDQVLEFFGDSNAFAEASPKIQVTLQFQENKDGAIVNSVVRSTLNAILPP